MVNFKLFWRISLTVANRTTSERIATTPDVEHLHLYKAATSYSITSTPNRLINIMYDGDVIEEMLLRGGIAPEYFDIPAGYPDHSHRFVHSSSANNF